MKILKENSVKYSKKLNEAKTMPQELKLELEIFEENNETYLWIGTENGSGAEYPVKTKSDIGNTLQTYLEIYYPDILK